ncbi:hypothetical protein LBMAG53_20440 [Planctomycetota bacterium]|nr:hypothetical protein LBMAG53_20440 [Planctomycetota bacterium]
MSRPTDPTAAPAHSPGKLVGGSAQRIPKVIAGFELIEKLGQGGMGAVFKARQVSMDRLVALKLLPPKFAQNAKFIERFQREARASARITHPNVVQGIDVGRDEASGLWYFAMELVEGENLRDRLKREKVFDERIALSLAKDVAAGLDAANRVGLVHRDIKPDNIMLTATGAKILDLGLAKQAEDDSALTQTGASIGTPLYMAPEQVRGQLDKIDTRTDLYALGATLYHLLTGKPPFVGETSAVILAKHLTEQPPRADRAHPGVSKGAADLVARLLQKDQAKRPADPATVVRIIDGLLSGKPTTQKSITTKRVSVEAESTRKTARLPIPALIAATIAGVAALGLGAWLLLGRPDAKPAAANAPAEATTTVSSQNAPAAADRKAELLAMLGYVKTWEESNPARHDEAIERYRKVITQAKGTAFELELADQAEAAISAVEIRRQASVDSAFADLSAKVKALADQGEIDGALRMCIELPPALAKPLERRTRSLASELKAEADAKIASAQAAVDQAFAEGRPDSAAAAVEGLASLCYAPAASAVETLRARLADVGARRIGGLLERFDAAMLKTGDAAAALAVADEAAKDPTLSSRGTTVQAMRSLAMASVAAVAAKQSAIDQAQKALIGTTVPMKGGGQGTVVSIDGDVAVIEIRIEVGNGAVATSKRKVPVADLPLPKGTSQTAEPTDDAGWVAAALARMRSGTSTDLEACETLLGRAEQFPLTERYRQALAVRRLGAVEVAALNAWKPLAARVAKLAGAPVTEAEAPALQAALDGFLAVHGRTKVAAERSSDIDQLRNGLVTAMGMANLPPEAQGGIRLGDRVYQVVKLDDEAKKKGWWSVNLRCRNLGGELAAVEDAAGDLAVHRLAMQRAPGALVAMAFSYRGWYGQHKPTWIPEVSEKPGEGRWGTGIIGGEQAKPWIAVQKQTIDYAMCEWVIANRPAPIPTPSSPLTQHGRFAPMNTRMSWADAKQHCEAVGGRLAVLASEADLIQIRQLIGSEKAERWWIGIRGTSAGYQWLDGRAVEDVPGLETEGAKDPTERKSLALRFNHKHSSMQLNDDPVEREYGFICEYPQGSTTSPTPSGPTAASSPGPRLPAPRPAPGPAPHFSIPIEQLSWDEAKQFCEARGGRLAVIDDETDLIELKTLMAAQSTGLCWVGAQKTAEGTFWVTGTRVNAKVWMPNEVLEPVPGHALRVARDGRFNSISMRARMQFILEIPTSAEPPPPSPEKPKRK